jgi:hypothetical protein
MKNIYVNPLKNETHKFMIIRYRLHNICYVYFVKNKQRKTYHLIQVIFYYSNILIVHLFKF